MKVAIHTNGTLPPSAYDTPRIRRDRLAIRMTVGDKVRTARVLDELRKIGLLSGGETIAELWPGLVLFLEHVLRKLRNGGQRESDYLRRLALPLAQIEPIPTPPTYPTPPPPFPVPPAKKEG